MKHKLLGIFSAVAILALMAVGSYAKYSYTQPLSNTVTTGTVRLDIVETAADKQYSILPGAVYERSAAVKNVGSGAFFTRLKVIKGVVDSELSADVLVLNVDTEHWIDGEDGFYYYYRALQPGETTEPLYTQVKIDNEMNNSYLGKALTIEVKADAVQTTNNGTDPLTSAGWPM